MFGRKTKRIKELEGEIKRMQYIYNTEWSKLQNECYNLRIENNRLRAKMPVKGANGRFIPRG